MPLMTNAEAFRYDFGIYATELWAMTEAQFLEWLNADCDRERPNTVPVVRCKDCKYFGRLDHEIYCYMLGANKRLRFSFSEDGYCSWGERRKEV